MSLGNDINLNTYEKMNNMKNMFGNSFIEILKPNIKAHQNESVIKVLEIAKDKPETYLELLPVSIFHKNFEIVKYMIEQFKLTENDSPYMSALSFHNSIFPENSEHKIEEAKENYLPIQCPFVIMSGIGGDIDIFKYLLKNKLISNKTEIGIVGLSKKLKNIFNSNIIGACCYYGKIGFLDYLLKNYKFDINISTTEKKSKNTNRVGLTREYTGMTPSMLGVVGLNSDEDTVKILKILNDHGCKFNINDNNKDNILHLATKNKKILVAKYLIDELNLKYLLEENNKDGYTPMSLAQHLNNEIFINYFSEKEKVDEKQIEENLKELINESDKIKTKINNKGKKKKHNKNEDMPTMLNSTEYQETLKPEKNETKHKKYEEYNDIANNNNNESENKPKKIKIKKSSEENYDYDVNENREKLRALLGKPKTKKKKEKLIEKEKEKEIEEKKIKKEEEIKEKEITKEEEIKKEEKKEENNKNIATKKENEEEDEGFIIGLGSKNKKNKKLKKINNKKEVDEKEKENKEEERKRKELEEEEEKRKEEERLLLEKKEKEERKRKEEERLLLEEQEQEKEKKKELERQRKEQEEIKRKKEEEERILKEKELAEKLKREQEEKEKKEKELLIKKQEEEEREKERLRQKQEKEKEINQIKEKEKKSEENDENEEEEEDDYSSEENFLSDKEDYKEKEKSQKIIKPEDYDKLNKNYLELERKISILEKEKEEMNQCLRNLYLKNKTNMQIPLNANKEENINDLMFLANKELENKNNIIHNLEGKVAILDLKNVKKFSSDKLKEYKDFYTKNLKIINDALKQY